MQGEVHCPSCGSADTLRKRLLDIDDYAVHERAEADDVSAEAWACLRCDHMFMPYPCPECGSYRINGARGVSGAPFLTPQVIVSCSDCKAEFPAHPSVSW